MVGHRVPVRSWFPSYWVVSCHEHAPVFLIQEGMLATSLDIFIIQYIEAIHELHIDPRFKPGYADSVWCAYLES